MPIKDRDQRLATMRAYAQSEAGKAAKRRSHRNYVEKRRALTNPLRAVFIETMAREIISRSRT